MRKAWSSDKYSTANTCISLKTNGFPVTVIWEIHIIWVSFEGPPSAQWTQQWAPFTEASPWCFSSSCCLWTLHHAAPPTSPLPPHWYPPDAVRGAPNKPTNLQMSPVIWPSKAVRTEDPLQQGGKLKTTLKKTTKSQKQNKKNTKYHIFCTQWLNSVISIHSCVWIPIIHQCKQNTFV